MLTLILSLFRSSKYFYTQNIEHSIVLWVKEIALFFVFVWFIWVFDVFLFLVLFSVVA